MQPSDALRHFWGATCDATADHELCDAQAAQDVGDVGGDEDGAASLGDHNVILTRLDFIKHLHAAAQLAVTASL